MSVNQPPLVGHPIINRMATSLLEASRAEGSGQILRVSHTKQEYIHRRHGFLGKHREYRHLPQILPSILRAADEVFGSGARQEDQLSSDQVRIRELDYGIEPLLPFSTTTNTQTIDSFASYGGVERASDTPPAPAYPASSPGMLMSDRQQLATSSPASLETRPARDYSDAETISNMSTPPRATPSETLRLPHAQLSAQAFHYPAVSDQQTANFGTGLHTRGTRHQVSNQQFYAPQRLNTMQTSNAAINVPKRPQVLAQIIADLGKKTLTAADAPSQYQRGTQPHLQTISQAHVQAIQAPAHQAHYPALSQADNDNHVQAPAALQSLAQVTHTPAQHQNGILTQFAEVTENPAQVQHGSLVASWGLNDTSAQSQQVDTATTTLEQDSGRTLLVPEPGARYQHGSGQVSAVKNRAVISPVKPQSSRKRSAPDDDEADTGDGEEVGAVESTSVTEKPTTKRQKKVAATSADDNTTVRNESNADETEMEVDTDTPQPAPQRPSRGRRTTATKAPRNAPVTAGPDPVAPLSESTRGSTKINSRTTSSRAAGSKSAPRKKADPAPHPTTGGKGPLHPASDEGCVNGTRMAKTKAEATDSAFTRYQRLLSQYSGHARFPDFPPEFFDKANFKPSEKRAVANGDTEGAPVRCVCGDEIDNGKPGREWVICDTADCGVWQHIDCMKCAVSEEQGYHCQQCDPFFHKKLIRDLRKGQPLQ
ncbi:hypothetical protein TI39_contig279g00047 [Zymoseptoria brevis]|uniref:Zinc finger PHD-type domain-containing protein n=1 Tax=Zymoseptoria brevis TaxID=1047168 RepID=A0A0F4GWC9_9PEZI|nr:hypothetical protein TI39_contig279g00047 [Zymoseptoria brevis]